MGESAWFDAVKTIRLDLLELCGLDYLADHVESEIRQQTGYKIYLSDLIKALAETQGVKVSTRYKDLLAMGPQKKEQSSEEVISKFKDFFAGGGETE